jgi:formate transporter
MAQLIAPANTHLQEPLTTDQLKPEDPFEPFSVGTMVDRVAAMAVEKAANPWAFFVRSLVGGAMVAFGALLALVVSTGVKTPGVASLLMGLAFGMSFVLILVSGMSLITADMAAGFLAVLKRTLSVRGYVFLVVVGLIGNIAGALVFVTVCGAAGGPYLGAFAERAATVGALKAGQPIWTALLLAVVCTWFLQTSMCMYFKARSDVARMTFAFYGPFAFVIGGTQHVIANVGFLERLPPLGAARRDQLGLRARRIAHQYLHHHGRQSDWRHSVCGPTVLDYRAIATAPDLAVGTGQ